MATTAVYSPDLTTETIHRIEAKRTEQIVKHGYSASHDDRHTHGELALGAIAYTAQGVGRDGSRYWPFDQETFKPKRPSLSNSDVLAARIANLTKAGALIAAEIERLERLKRAKAGR